MLSFWKQMPHWSQMVVMLIALMGVTWIARAVDHPDLHVLNGAVATLMVWWRWRIFATYEGRSFSDSGRIAGCIEGDRV